MCIRDSSEGAAKAADASDSAPGASSSRVKRMEATGPVTVISKDQVGTGNSGVYDKAENKVYLIGNVTLSLSLIHIWAKILSSLSRPSPSAICPRLCSKACKG